jgi:SAM-dependent methyltransferase
MGATPRPRTLKGDWDRFYTEFPDVYDRFAVESGATIAALRARFSLDNSVIIDAGSGTGRSTFALAKTARFVCGLEPWAPMRAIAVARARALGIPNVAFVDAPVEKMPFRAGSVDHIVSVYGFPFWFVDGGAEGRELAERFVADGSRVVRPGGSLIVVNSRPGWEAGELTPLVLPGADEAERVHQLLTSLGFADEDFDVEADYGSVQEAVETYGFIYGDAAIRALIDGRRSTLAWPMRVHYRTVAATSD